MPVLADTRRMPLETAAAVYEADGANDDFMRATFRGDCPLPLDMTNWSLAYREAAESLVTAGFTALDTAELLEQTLTAATDRVRHTNLPGIPRAALDSLAAIYMALAAPDWNLMEHVPMRLIHTLEDTCESYGVISAEERTTCHHGRSVAVCCA
ncbi:MULTISPECIES: hypothetical protein [unclassified Streptomyces]|uniref:hypothetical protein n=1 Tax=unclassified Streptomyces TaxID=2593676 RepID=UPI0035DB95CA